MIKECDNNEINNYSVSIGRCGPTDCTLMLNKRGYLSKEYGIESDGWNKVDKYWDVNKQQSKKIPNEIGDFIYYNFDEDIIDENK